MGWQPGLLQPGFVPQAGGVPFEVVCHALLDDVDAHAALICVVNRAQVLLVPWTELMHLQATASPRASTRDTT